MTTARHEPSAAGLQMEAAGRRGRLPGIDVARAAALLAMAVYHGAWDASYLGLTAVDVVNHGGWRLFARAIAASFLALVGLSLVLAHRDGVRWRPFLRRLGMIAAAAGAITLATAQVFPQSYIFFGILHCIALASVLALPFLRLPPLLTAAAGLVVIAAPAFVRLPLFDAPWLAFVGLGTRVPVSNDYVPLFPWFGPVLLGMALGRLAEARGLLVRLAGSAGKGPLARPLAFLGRHSLAFYLVHQPVLFGLMFLAAQALGVARQPEPSAFIAQCRARCEEAGVAAAQCVRYCDCADAAIRREGIDLSDRSPEGRGRVTRIVNACRAAIGPQP